MALSMWTATTSPSVSQACAFSPFAPCNWMICDSLHSNETGLSATRGTLTSLLGTAVSPAILNSLTSWATCAAVRFICCARSMVARFQTNLTAAHVAHDVSEFKIAGLTAVPSRLVNVPRVAESPVSFECKLSQIIQLQGANGEKAQAWLTLGEVVAVHIDKAMIKDGVYQTGLARPIVRAGRKGDYFEIRPDAMFEMTRPD